MRGNEESAIKPNSSANRLVEISKATIVKETSRKLGMHIKTIKMKAIENSR